MYSARAHNMYNRSTERQKHPRLKPNEVVAKWESILRDWDSQDGNESRKARQRAKALVRSDSIPDFLRSEVWFRVSGANELHDKNVDVYDHLCERETKDSDQIGRDVGRTFTSYGQSMHGIVSEENLRRVLTAYAVFDPHLGYCQGMNFICALILMLCRDEIRCFWIFVVVIKRVRGLFIDGLPGYNKAVHYFEKLYAHHLPDLANYFGKNEIRAHLFCTSWFHSLFAYPSLDMDVTKRIWDVFVVHDFTALIRISFTILAMNKNILMNFDFVTTIEFLKNLPFLDDTSKADALVRKAFSIRLKEKYIEPLRDLNTDVHASHVRRDNSSSNLDESRRDQDEHQYEDQDQDDSRYDR